jgi:hypothetical protein
MNRKWAIYGLLLLPFVGYPQSGGKTADVHSFNRAYAGLSGGLTGNLTYTYFTSPQLDLFSAYSIREKYILEVLAGANLYDLHFGGSIGFIMSADQKFVKRKGFTRSYKFVHLGYRWHEQLVYDTGVPNGHVLSAGINWCWERERWHRLRIAVGYNLMDFRPNACPPNIDCSPWMPEVSYSIALPVYKSKR